MSICSRSSQCASDNSISNTIKLRISKNFLPVKIRKMLPDSTTMMMKKMLMLLFQKKMILLLLWRSNRLDYNQITKIKTPNKYLSE